MPLRRQGAGFTGICPWHDDTKPSLQVNPARQSWKCWVCNIGGDVFSFVMQNEGINFREALEMLADRAGIVLQQTSPQQRATPGSPNDKKTLYAACAWAEQQFRDCLWKSPEGEVARRYFADRAVNEETLKSFHIGFAPNGWQWLLDRSRSTPYSPAVLEAAWLVGKGQSGKYYDRFRGRVIFPIRDLQSRPIGFGGRILPEFADERSSKYVNSGETRLYSKSDQLYALDLAKDPIRGAKNAVVVEGYTDVNMAHQFGLKNVVACCGTALGERHIRLLKRHTDSITLVLDGDEAGQSRTNEILELFVASEMDLRILTLPEGLDPCDFLLQRGAEEMRSLLSGAVDAFEHAIETRTRGIDLLRDTHRANQALEQLLGIISKAPRLTTATSSSRVVRERQVIARLAREFRLEDSVLRTRIVELRKATPMRRPDGRLAVTRSITPKDLDPCDAELLELLTQHPELAEKVLAEIAVSELTNDSSRVIYEKYEVVLEKGEPVEFTRILTELEDPQLKSLLVSLDEQATEKERHAQEDASARLCRLIDHIRLRREESERQASMAALEQQHLGEQEESDLLQTLVDQQRKRQGIQAPTDG
jgi:DNA primase